MTRLESLLLIASPEEGGGPQRLDNVKLPPYLTTADDDNIEDRFISFTLPFCLFNNSSPRTRGNRAKHLGRVAAEYTQLLYHVSKARAAKCVFVDEIQWVCDFLFFLKIKCSLPLSVPHPSSVSTESSQRSHQTLTIYLERYYIHSRTARAEKRVNWKRLNGWQTWRSAYGPMTF